MNVHLADFGMDFLNDGDSGGKLLQRGAIVGRWDGHTLNLGGVGRMAAEHVACMVAAWRPAAGVILIFDPSAKF